MADLHWPENRGNVLSLFRFEQQHVGVLNNQIPESKISTLLSNRRDLVAIPTFTHQRNCPMSVPSKLLVTGSTAQKNEKLRNHMSTSWLLTELLSTKCSILANSPQLRRTD